MQNRPLSLDTKETRRLPFLALSFVLRPSPWWGRRSCDPRPHRPDDDDDDGYIIVSLREHHCHTSRRSNQSRPPPPPRRVQPADSASVAGWIRRTAHHMDGPAAADLAAFLDADLEVRERRLLSSQHTDALCCVVLCCVVLSSRCAWRLHSVEHTDAWRCVWCCVVCGVVLCARLHSVEPMRARSLR